MEKIKQILPLDGVEGLANIKLEKKGRGLALVQAPSAIANIQEVVMDASCFNEGALGVGDEACHVGAQPSGEHLRNNFRDRVDRN